MITDVPNSGVALAVNEVTREKNKVFLVARPWRRWSVPYVRACETRVRVLVTGATYPCALPVRFAERAGHG
jgi:hypothetical protein